MFYSSCWCDFILCICPKIKTFFCSRRLPDWTPDDCRSDHTHQDPRTPALSHPPITWPQTPLCQSQSDVSCHYMWHVLPIKTNPAKLMEIFMFIFYIFGINTVWIFRFYKWSHGITNTLVHFLHRACLLCFIWEHDQENDEGRQRGNNEKKGIVVDENQG